MGLNDKPKGLGDTVENILENTGIAKVVKYLLKRVIAPKESII